MYKVFVDNISKTYQLDDEIELLKVFDDHKFIEAAGGLVQREQEYLFIKRHGKWDIPKGKLDSGEAVEAAAVREIEEECGLINPKIKCHLLNTWHTYQFPDGPKVLKKTYWYLLEEGPNKTNLVPQGEEGITEVLFLSPQEFDKVKSNTYASIVDVLSALEDKL